jgi:peptidoglycan/LPS O-acetylase OafA/YrhL
MGIFRFILALLVFLAHIPGRSTSFEVANSAVIGFYFISGLLVTKSLAQFSNGHNGIVATLQFYTDRIIRLWPLFFVSIILVVLFRGFVSQTIKFDADLLNTVWMNLAILPLAFVKAFDGVAIIIHGADPTSALAASLINLQEINGVSWSLGAEFVFYLVLPLFFFLPRSLKIGVCWLTVVLHLACLYLDRQAIFYSTYQNIGFASPKPASLLYGYFFPLFAIAPFLMGSLYATGTNWPVTVAYAGYFLVFFLFGQAGAAMANSGVFEIVFGVLLFAPIAVLLEKYKFESATVERIDSYLGLLSYPIFILHVFAIDVVMYLFPTNTMSRFLVAYLIVFAMCPILVMMQRKIDTVRYKVRGFGRTKDLSANKKASAPVALVA